MRERGASIGAAMRQVSDKEVRNMPHTPGPWRIGDVRANGEVLIHGDRQIVASAIQGHREYTAEANARLIAAAPDLLDALEELRRWFDDNVSTYEPHCSPEYAEMWERVRKAISKARGEQNKK